MHRPLRGALQQRHRAVLADDPFPSFARHLVILPGRRPATVRRATDARRDRVDVVVAVDQTQPCSSASVAVRGAHRGVERVAFALPSRSGARCRRVRRATVVGHVDDDDEIGLDAARRHPVELLDDVHAEPAHDPLVHERRRHVAVAHDPLPAREGRGRSRSATCCARSAAMRSASVVGCDRLATVQQQLADAPPRRRSRRARRSRTPRDLAAAARRRARAAWVLFPLPSPPSSTTNRPRVIERLRSGATRRCRVRPDSVTGDGDGRSGRRPDRPDAATIAPRRQPRMSRQARPATSAMSRHPRECAHRHDTVRADDDGLVGEELVGDPVPEVGPQRRDGERDQQAQAHDRVERGERAPAHLVARRSPATREPGDVRVPAHAPTAADEQRRRRDRRERRREHEEAAGPDHREGRTPVLRGRRALEPQQRDHAERGAEPERGHQHAERRGAAVEHLAGEARTERDHRARADEAEPEADASRRARAACCRTNTQPLLDVAEGLGPVDALAVRPLSPRDREAATRSPPTRGTSSRRRPARATSWSTLNAEMRSSSPSTVATPASNEKMIDAIGNVP